MDLRIVKTRRAIHQAFLDIRKSTPLEKVKVRDICDRALINKSTFYAHYQDVYALSREMENAAIDGLFEKFEEQGLLFADPEAFLYGFSRTLDAGYDLFSILFNNRFEVFFPIMEERVKGIYTSPTLTFEEEVTLTFIVFGMLRILGEYKRLKTPNEDALIHEVASIIKKISAPDQC